MAKSTKSPTQGSSGSSVKPSKGGELPKPVGRWCSLLSLVRDFKPHVFATAIEQEGVYVLDRFERPILATSQAANQHESVEYVLSLLAGIAAELRDPGPTCSLDDEMWDVVPHPLLRFGWPEAELPDFDKYKVVQYKQPPKSIPWTQRSAQEFEDEVNQLGSKSAAAQKHGVSRQAYTRKMEKAQRRDKSELRVSAPWVQSLTHLSAGKK